MAPRIRIAKDAKGLRPLDRPNRAPATTRQAGLYLLALRSRVAHTEHLVLGRKLIVPIEPGTAAEAQPQSIKITIS